METLGSQGNLSFQVWIGQKFGRSQPVEERGKYQSKCYSQKGIHNAQDYRPLEPIDSGSQHQRAETVHSGFIPVIDAKAQT